MRARELQHGWQADIVFSAFQVGLRTVPPQVDPSIRISGVLRRNRGGGVHEATAYSQKDIRHMIKFSGLVYEWQMISPGLHETNGAGFVAMQGRIRRTWGIENPLTPMRWVGTVVMLFQDLVLIW